jgi:hypothetical protein
MPVTAARKLCRHCRSKPVTRSRGLCSTCYHRPAVSALYPSTHPKGMRGNGAGLMGAGRPLPAEPTAEPPGTPGKVSVLESRASRGESLFHPEDAT